MHLAIIAFEVGKSLEDCGEKQPSVREIRVARPWIKSVARQRWVLSRRSGLGWCLQAKTQVYQDDANSCQFSGVMKLLPVHDGE